MERINAAPIEYEILSALFTGGYLLADVVFLIIDKDFTLELILHHIAIVGGGLYIKFGGEVGWAGVIGEFTELTGVFLNLRDILPFLRIQQTCRNQRGYIRSCVS